MPKVKDSPYPLTYIRVFGGPFDGQEFVVYPDNPLPEYISADEYTYWPRAEAKDGALIYVEEGVKWELLKF